MLVIVRSVAISCVLFIFGMSAVAQEQHADYVVLGKSINHRQSANGDLHLLNTVFFAEVFKTKGGIVTNAYLEGPGEAADGLRFPEGDVLFLAGNRQYSIEALTANFPDTTYHFNFDTPDGNVRRLPATFRREAGERLNPGPIHLTLYQGGNVANPLLIDPDLDLTVRWSSFDKGTADPRGIIDDLIFVMMGDCFANETVHSGHALSDEHALTYVAEDFVIPSSKLFAGQPFQLEVEHSNMETDVRNDIEIIVTYAATSFLDFKTTGRNTQNPACPNVPYAMDGGQTDRHRIE